MVLTCCFGVVSLAFFFLNRLVVLIALSSILGCSSEPRVHAFSGAIMGTTYSVKLIEGGSPNFDDPAVLNAAETLSYEALVRVDEALSTYKESSELMRFNRSDVGSVFKMGKEMRDVTTLSLAILNASDGFFDPSIGNLISAWGFGAHSHDATPSGEKVAALLAQSGMRFVKVLDGAEIKKVGKGFVDYSAIAKGYGVDKVAEGLSSLGFGNFIVEVGGEVRVAGHNAEGKPWRLGIEQPDILERKAYNIAHISDVSMATSGDYRNFIERPEGRYSHTINPQTGYPVSNQVASVSVIMKSCAIADAWATALLAMGEDRALEVAKEQGLAVFFIFRDKDGFRSHATEQMLAYLG